MDEEAIADALFDLLAEAVAACYDTDDVGGYLADLWGLLEAGRAAMDAAEPLTAEEESLLERFGFPDAPDTLSCARVRVVSWLARASRRGSPRSRGSPQRG